MTRFTLLVTLALASIASLRAEDLPPFQDDFRTGEFVQRRARVMDSCRRPSSGNCRKSS